ncbi:MAG: alpha/beta fold hydrolase [Cyanobacteria bacterium J06632_22]
MSKLSKIAAATLVNKSKRRWPRGKRFITLTTGLIAGLTTGLATAFVATPAEAADNIRFRYGIYELTITREELETFAETGEAEGGLATVLSRLSPKIQEQLQGALNGQYDLDPVLANRFSYTSSGEQLLTEIGNLVQTESGQNGAIALRSALTLAAAEPEGVTMLNFLEHFPTDIELNISQLLSFAEEMGSLLGGTQQVVDGFATETAEIAATQPSVNFDALPDPRQPGNYSYTVQTLTLYDEARDRTLVTDLYTPDLTSSTSKAPVIIISNGLGARRDRFIELAQHLVSHGFAVAIPDHPGSDRERLSDFYNGLESENFEPEEFLDRPQDVSFVLDELTRRNATEFNDQLNPDQAGIFGYSFGGTTALAVAGAEIDRAHLQESCETRSSLFNISLLYQCRALELDEGAIASTPLQDDRIKATYVFVPFSRSLYGPEGIAQVEGPLLWEATDKDILTPLVVEQLPAFSWLTGSPQFNPESDDFLSPNTPTPNTLSPQSPDRYLAITSGLPHARVTFEVLSRLTDQAATDWDSIRLIADSYHQSLTAAFFQVHLANDETYRPYLQARGAQFLTQEPYTLTWQTPQP